MHKLLLSLSVLALSVSASAQTSETIRLNQVGMYPAQEKYAVIEQGKAGQPFEIKDAAGKTVLKGKASRVAKSPWSGKVRTIADFTKLTTPGTYTFNTGKDSHKFTISPTALKNLANGVLNSYYIIRSGIPIEEKYAGQCSRPEGHPDTVVYIHESAATIQRPAGTVISSPYGWYDAGDYNKYIVNSAFTIGQILTVYEMNKNFFSAQKLSIPENSNATPDVLDEMMFNLRWMFTMQDPADGGVYHKLTTPSFEAFVMPKDCHQKRYVVEKSTAATLDFAAVMAMAARIYKGNADYPDFSTRAEAAAERAWQWAVAHPTVYYDQPEMNKHFKPEVTTGAYDDTDTHDEFFWAATELYLLSGEANYLDAVRQYAPSSFSLPAWGNVAGLGRFEWAMNNSKNPTVSSESQKQIIDYCKAKLNADKTSCFQTPDGNDSADFHWASLAESFGTTGITYLFAYSFTHDSRYLTMAQENADYILGRNATGYCFITGFGQKSPMHPHHRISSADGIEAPVPGLLVGGPNAGQQDKPYLGTAKYPSNYPDESYIDSSNSYASNEIAINWNASAVGLFSWLAALQDK